MASKPAPNTYYQLQVHNSTTCLFVVDTTNEAYPVRLGPCAAAGDAALWQLSLADGLYQHIINKAMSGQLDFVQGQGEPTINLILGPSGDQYFNQQFSLQWSTANEFQLGSRGLPDNVVGTFNHGSVVAAVMLPSTSGGLTFNLVDANGNSNSGSGSGGGSSSISSAPSPVPTADPVTSQVQSQSTAADTVAGGSASSVSSPPSSPSTSTLVGASATSLTRSGGGVATSASGFTTSVSASQGTASSVGPTGTTASGSHPDALSRGVIAGIIVGAVAVVTMLALAVCWFFCCRGGGNRLRRRGHHSSEFLVTTEPSPQDDTRTPVSSSYRATTEQRSEAGSIPLSDIACAEVLPAPASSGAPPERLAAASPSTDTLCSLPLAETQPGVQGGGVVPHAVVRHQSVRPNRWPPLGS